VPRKIPLPKRPRGLKPDHVARYDQLVRAAGPAGVALCRYCKTPAYAYGGTRRPRLRPKTRCDGCYEFTSRLDSFLRHGPRARALVKQALADATKVHG
jgi:hypothetical protein